MSDLGEADPLKFASDGMPRHCFAKKLHVAAKDHSMLDMTPATWISGIGAAISLLGASASWYWSRTRFKWDAGKELGPLRVETLELLSKCSIIGMVGSGFSVSASTPPDTWLDAKMSWKRNFHARAPALGKKSYSDMIAIEKLIDDVETRVFGPRRLLFADLFMDEASERQPVSHDSWQRIQDWKKKIIEDPHFLYR